MKHLSFSHWAFIVPRFLPLRWAVLLLAAFFPASPSYAQTLTSLTISPAQPAVVIGGAKQLTATASYSNGSSDNVTDNVTWSSSDPRMVNVSSKGVASGFATGNVVITAGYKGKTATATIASSIADIEWSGPLTITKGGTYSGNWKSTDPNTPAVNISTTDPVVIENSYVTGPADLIDDPVHGNNLTVKNVIGIGVNPNVSGQSYGLFVDAQNSVLLDVEHCYFENVRFGVYLRGYAGNRNGTETVTILNNRGRNILGVESNGNNGTLAGETHWHWAHAFQLGGAYGVPGIKIAWNEIVNYPSKSLVNEVINMFQSGGTSSSPADVNDNYLQGAYAYNPAVDSYNGGGFVTDGSSSDTVTTASSYINIYNNQVVGTVNLGIGLGTGHNNSAYDNRVLSSGLLPNGTKIPAQNVGLVVSDDGQASTYSNDMHDNTVGWMCWTSGCAWDGYRNDEYFPAKPSDYSTNQSISANPITLAMESAEYQTWLAKISSNGMVVGPTVSSASSGSGGSGGGSGISTTAWYTIVNTNSTLCVDAASGGTANGTQVQQNTCGSAQTYQQWQFQATVSGYYKLVNRKALNAGKAMVWNVTGGDWATANGALIQLYSWIGATNEEWMPVSVGNNAYKFVARSSSKCLDVPDASSAPLLQLQQYTCNGTGAQSYTLNEQ